MTRLTYLGTLAVVLEPLTFDLASQAGRHTVPRHPGPTQRDARRDQEKTISDLGSMSGRHSKRVGRALCGREVVVGSTRVSEARRINPHSCAASNPCRRGLLPY